MLKEKVEKLKFVEIDRVFSFINLDSKPDYYLLQSTQVETEIEGEEFWLDTIIGLGWACVDCKEPKRVTLSKQEEDFFLGALRKVVLKEKEAIKKWNREIEGIPEEEYEEREMEFLDNVVIHVARREDFDEAMEKKELVKPLERLVGKRCKLCKRPHVWRISVGSDLKILSRRKVKETCPRCGRLGTKYIDKRGYAYFQHWVEGKRQVCYIGKVKRDEKSQ